LPEIPKGSTILTFVYDSGEKYLSIEGLFWNFFILIWNK
jgi:cysteine synthase A